MWNPTVLAIRRTGLIVAIVIMTALSYFVFRGAQWIRPVAFGFAIIMIANALGHTVGTILGHTVESVRFARPAPGLLFSAAPAGFCFPDLGVAGK